MASGIRVDRMTPSERPHGSRASRRWPAPDALQCRYDVDVRQTRFAITRIDHVQLAMPAGAEAQAEAFYDHVLGLERRPKPAPLAARGGCWFENGEVRVHLGVETPFVPARKAHPAFRVADLDALARDLTERGFPVRWSDELPVRRFYVDDPFGNRLEMIEE
jgi:catechol 2,3-dioxygenase-like lactoylglutathione lyase family enzyme